MNYVKLDRRHSRFGTYQFMIKFVKTRQGRIDRASCAEKFTRMYGPDIAFKETHDPFESCFVKNEHWLIDTTRNRIYFNDETAITFILLAMEHNK